MKKLLLILVIVVLALCGCASVYDVSTDNPTPGNAPIPSKTHPLPTTTAPIPTTTVPVPATTLPPAPTTVPATEPWEAEPSFDPKSLLELLPDALQLQIREDYCAASADMTADQVSLRVFGISGQTYIMLVDGGMHASVETQETVGDFLFCYTDANRLKVYLDGKFYSLSEAYSNGLLTDEDLQTVFDNYYNAYPYLWALYYGSDE